MRVACNEPGNVFEKTSYVIQTNSAGFRCEHEPGVECGETIKVLFIGCSFTAGDGVSNKRRFTDLLEKKDRSLKIHNCALSATGSDQQYLVHRDMGPVIDPDVLVVSPYAGCLGRNLFPHKISYDNFSGGLTRQPKPFFTIDENDRLTLQNIPVPKVTLESGNNKSASRENTGLIGRTIGRGADKIKGALAGLLSKPSAALASYEDEKSKGYRLMRRILEMTVNESNASIKILLPLPHKESLDAGARPDYLPLFERVASDTGAKLWDVSERLLKLPPGSIPGLFLSDGHYGEAGHGAVADFLVRKFSEI